MGLWIKWLDLFTTCAHQSELQAITALSLTSTICISPQHPLSFFQPFVTSPVVPWQELLTFEILQLPALGSFLRRPSFKNACQLFPQLNWIAVSSQPPLKSSTVHNTQITISDIFSAGLGSSLFSLGLTQQKTPFPTIPLLLLAYLVPQERVYPVVA
jgi:hypothetical protein